ncbi:DNA polymerase III subunit delta [Hymenobacter taeanensis]|uniref:DNA polymerase III subunit delta n=1 Tax=Hymenobacter taeanensis TaxID=2735321 RepID=A0A6M6BC68_9BACT|nr:MULTISPECIES: DNA polymerase III subunit delta [Hymenobacter]QJX46001.1 DNA polymerase III subunit delta [Hymenobacter taeanensis]UOQ79853.1 DNA polymerase III subunit delta [Hymenobacter sp. 5414T-23]
MRFSDIPGQQSVKQVLVQSVQRQHVAHAQLFRGAEGSAALALALAYAAFLNCENRPHEAEDSCGICVSCQKIDKLVHPDLNFIVPVTTTKAVSKDAVSSKFAADWRAFVLANPYQGLNDWMQHIGADNKQGSISKEESLQLLKLVSLKAFEAQFKLVVIWLPELMHPAASNAVLKLLEEPPPATVFLLVSNAPEQLLPTIISRVQPVVVRPIPEAELTDWLHAVHHVPEAKARQIAQLVEGNPGAALASKDAATADNDYFTFFVDWMRLCFSGKVDKMLTTADEFQKLGRENQKELLQYALTLLRKVLLFGVDPQLVPHLPTGEQQFVQGFSRFVTPRNADTITRELNEAHYHVERNANPRMVFVDTSLRVAELLKMA